MGALWMGPFPPPSDAAVHIKMHDCKKDCGLDLQSQVEKWIAGRNAIHFDTRNVDLECTPFKKDFADTCPFAVGLDLPANVQMIKIGKNR